jgi:hypothetical protein
VGKTCLVLDKKLDTLNGSGGGLGDGGGDTTHCRYVSIDVLDNVLRRLVMADKISRWRGVLENVLKKSTTKPGMPMKDLFVMS